MDGSSQELKRMLYFCVAFCGFCLCLGVGIFLYDLPVRGSLVIILLMSMLYIIVALGLGLTISAMIKNQFLACQVSLLISFLPSMMLSGFLFDLHSQPLSAITEIPVADWQLLATNHGEILDAAGVWTGVYRIGF